MIDDADKEWLRTERDDPFQLITPDLAVFLICVIGVIGLLLRDFA